MAYEGHCTNVLDPLGRCAISASRPTPHGGTMSSKLLVRDLPPELHRWLKDQSYERRISQNELSLAILRDAYRSDGTLSLFEQPVVQQAEPQSAPFTFIDLFAGIGGL